MSGVTCHMSHYSAHYIMDLPRVAMAGLRKHRERGCPNQQGSAFLAFACVMLVIDQNSLCGNLNLTDGGGKTTTATKNTTQQNKKQHTFS